MAKKYTWYKIANEESDLKFAINNMLLINVENKAICIAKGKTGLYACAHKCPHAGGSIEEGFIDALDNVVCPLHHYKFSLKSGKDVNGEGYFLKTYPMEQNEKGIFVGIEQRGLFYW